MVAFSALLETSVGRIALERFAASANMSQAAMRAELFANGPLANYFCQVCRKALDDVKAEAA